jgi:hypothetical protein
MADYGYIAVFDKKEARIYDGTTTTILANGEPIIIAPRCTDKGLWKMELDLDYEILGREYPEQFIAGVDEANAIFDLPNSRQTLQYFHATAGFPTKETPGCGSGRELCNMAGSHDHTDRQTLPGFRRDAKGHMKGQRKGVRSTKVKQMVDIKIEPGTEEATNNCKTSMKLY